MSDLAWTRAEEVALRAAYRRGAGPDQIAVLLDRTAGSIRWKITALGLATLPCAAPGSRKSHRKTVAAGRAAAKRGDVAFHRAMFKAIASGSERAPSTPQTTKATS